MPVIWCGVKIIRNEYDEKNTINNISKQSKFIIDFDQNMTSYIFRFCYFFDLILEIRLESFHILYKLYEH